MILRSVQVRSFKSVTDSEPFEIDKHVTCLVGKNESGKTAILEALYRLNPLPGHVQDFSPLRDYPRRTLKAVAEKRIDATVPIEVHFEVDEDDVAQMDEDFGEGVIATGN